MGRGGAHQQGVAVRVGARDYLAADHATGARAVLDQHLLAQQFGGQQRERRDAGQCGAVAQAPVGGTDRHVDRVSHSADLLWSYAERRQHHAASPQVGHGAHWCTYRA